MSFHLEVQLPENEAKFKIEGNFKLLKGPICRGIINFEQLCFFLQAAMPNHIAWSNQMARAINQR